MKIPAVYLDCETCDFDHIRSEITFVDYVRDPNLADIHVFVTDEETAGGGNELSFTFIGLKTFKGNEYTLEHHVNRNATKAERREEVLSVLKRGLVSYLLQTPLGKYFHVSYHGFEIDPADVSEKDPWAFWVFEAYVGGLQLELESNQKSFDSRWGIFADRITEDWKFRIRPYFNFNWINIQTKEGDQSVTGIQRRHGLDSYALMSIGDHWSTGIFNTYYTYNGRNIKHEFLFMPGIEYNLFPYQMATRKSVILRYQLGYGLYNYFEETIFGKTKETLVNHQLNGMISIQQPWGSVETGFRAMQYFHDLSRRRIEFIAQASLRLFKGFSLVLQTDYNLINDQFYLPKTEASLEDVLLDQRELATDFSFSTTVAITYTFGSKFTNIVNTRFKEIDFDD